jgi:hypothetical protein
MSAQVSDSKIFSGLQIIHRSHPKISTARRILRRVCDLRRTCPQTTGSPQDSVSCGDPSGGLRRLPWRYPLDWSVWFRNEAGREILKSCPGGDSKKIRYNSGICQL